MIGHLPGRKWTFIRKRALIAVSFPLVFVILDLFAACAGNTQSTGPATSLSQTVDGVQISVSLDPNPLLPTQNTKVEITISDKVGNPIRDARVVVSLNPAAHGMTPVIAAAEPQGNGTYSAILRPSGMTGEHYINVDFQRNGKAYQASFKKLIVK